jgi:WD40 repeat protein
MAHVVFPIHLWDATTGRYLRSLPGHPEGVMSASFSADGKTLASGGIDNTLRFWDVTTGKPLGEPLGHDGHVYNVHFTPDGKQVVSASNELRLWDAAGRKEIRKFERTPSPRFFTMTVLSPDGKTVAAMGDAETYLWNVADGKRLGSVTRKDGVGPCPEFFSADGKSLFAHDARGQLGCWDVSTGKADPDKSVALPQEVYEFRFSADGKRALGEFRGRPFLVEMATGKKTPLRDSSPHFWGQFSLDGKTLALGREDGALELWDATDATLRHAILDSPQPIITLQYSGAERLVSLSADGVMRQWDVAEERELRRRRPTLPDGHMALRLSPDGGALASVDGKGGLRLWDTGPGREAWSRAEMLKTGVLPGLREPWHRKTRAGKTAAAVEVAFSADGKTLAGVAGEGNEIAVWDVRRGDERHRFDTEQVYGVALSGDGKTLFAGGRETDGVGVRAWDVASGKEIRRVAVAAREKGEIADRNPLAGLASSPDGKAVAIVEEIESVVAEGRKGTNVSYQWRVYLWNTDGKDAPRLISKEAATQVTFSPDGKSLGFMDQGHVAIWDLTKGVLRRAPEPGGDVTALAFSPDGKMVAAGCLDGTILLWDVTKLKAVKPKEETGN